MWTIPADIVANQMVTCHTLLRWDFTNYDAAMLSSARQGVSIVVTTLVSVYTVVTVN